MNSVLPFLGSSFKHHPQKHKRSCVKTLYISAMTHFYTSEANEEETLLHAKILNKWLTSLYFPETKVLSHENSLTGKNMHQK